MKKIIKILSFMFLMFLLSSCNNTNKQVKVIDVKLTDEQYAFVVKKGNKTLVDEFNLFLDEIKENGEFNELVEKYFEGKGKKQGVKVTTTSIENTEDLFVVATNCPFSPFEYIGDDGLVYGLDIEIAAKFAQMKGKTLVVKNISFDSIFTEVDAGYADIGMAGITVNEDRLKSYDFTNPYYEASQKLVVSQDNTMFNNCKKASEVEDILKSLQNQSIGYQNGTTGNWYVAGDSDWGFDGFSNITPVGYTTAQLAIQDVVDGRIFGVVVDDAPANAIVQNMSNWGNKLETFLDTLKQATYRELILTGLKNTILIACLGLVIGILIGTVLAVIKVAPKYKLFTRILDKFATVYIGIFRGTPIVVQLLIAYYVLLPILGVTGVEALTVGIWVFGLNSAAYVAEIMRGGLNSVDRGQLEAGRAVGLSYPTTMIKIIVPQAIKNTLPSLGNEFITLIKETSVVSFITVVDLYTAFNTIGTNKYSVVVPYIVMALIYIVLIVVITILIKIMERALKKNDRSN